LIFRVFGTRDALPSNGKNLALLVYDNWDDYGFKTTFHVYLFDDFQVRHDLGSVKIGFSGQTIETQTIAALQRQFEQLPEEFFSVASDVEYYSTLGTGISEQLRTQFLTAIRDVAFEPAAMARAENEKVFGTSLLRGVSLSVVLGQYKRVLAGGAPLSDFGFSYKRPQDDKYAGVDLEFGVKAESLPSTNIHAIIGRNGIGKTTLLNGMIEAITNPLLAKGKFYTKSIFLDTPIPQAYFSSLVSVSFSAFDPFPPPAEQPDPAKGTCYFYVGLKDNNDSTGSTLRHLDDLYAEFSNSIGECFTSAPKMRRWLTAIRTLESDDNFAEMKLADLVNFRGDDLKNTALWLIKRMSSGHVIVLLTITRLVAKVEEKTLVLLDEPESHLHPQLLSAFTRALSELLHDRNGVAIIATHSPVVLQELPRVCAWKITCSRLSLTSNRPTTETFGENVGVLTREVFGLEVTKSGFHAELTKAVAKGGSYEQILQDYSGQLGFEAKGILRALVAARDTGVPTP
jgi:predicted ATPase